MNNRFQSIKSNYKDKVVIIKSGMFYVTYEEDALIVRRITNYKLLLPDYRLGFPSQKLLEIKDKLIRLNISVVVVEKGNDIKEYTAANNRYNEVVKLYKEQMDFFKLVDSFLDDLRRKIIVKRSLMDSIKKVVEGND